MLNLLWIIPYVPLGALVGIGVVRWGRFDVDTANDALTVGAAALLWPLVLTAVATMYIGWAIHSLAEIVAEQADGYR